MLGISHVRGIVCPLFLVIFSRLFGEWMTLEDTGILIPRCKWFGPLRSVSSPVVHPPCVQVSSSLLHTPVETGAQDTGIRMPVLWLLLLLRWWTLCLIPESFVSTWALMMPCRPTCWLASRVDLGPPCPGTLTPFSAFLLLPHGWHILVLYRCHSSHFK